MYDSLGLLFGAYLHQDFGLVHGSPDGAVRGFCESEPHQVVGAIAEIDGLLDSDVSEERLRSLLDELGSYYRLEAGGYNARTWLEHVRDLLIEEAEKAR